MAEPEDKHEPWRVKALTALGEQLRRVADVAAAERERTGDRGRAREQRRDEEQEQARGGRRLHRPRRAASRRQTDDG